MILYGKYCTYVLEIPYVVINRNSSYAQFIPPMVTMRKTSLTKTFSKA